MKYAKNSNLLRKPYTHALLALYKKNNRRYTVLTNKKTYHNGVIFIKMIWF